MVTPNFDVLVKLNRFNYVESKKTLDFYSSKGWKHSGKKMRDSYYKSGGYINYITRKTAVVKADLSLGDLKGLNNIRTTDAEKYNTELEKINDISLNMSGIWSKNGHLNMVEENILRDKMKNLSDNQLMWDSIISIDRKFAAEYEFMTVSQFHKVISKNINAFFVKAGFHNPEKMDWFFSMHSNTDNPHIHLGFFENSPQFLNKKNGKVCYKKLGALPQNSFAYFGEKIRESIIRESLKNNNLINDRKKITDLFKMLIEEGVDEEFKLDNKKLSEKFSSKEIKLMNWSEAKQIYTDLNIQIYGLSEKLSGLSQKFVKKNNYSKISYATLDEETKIEVDNISILLLNTVPSLKNEFESWKDEIINFQNRLTKIKEDEDTSDNNDNSLLSIHEILENRGNTDRDNNIKNSLNFFDDQLNDVKNGLMSRLGNIVIKKALNLINIKKSNERNLSTKLRQKFNDNDFYNKHAISAWDQLLNGLNELFSQKKSEAFKKFQKLRRERIQMNKQEILKIKKQGEKENG